jgi:cytochrome c-type biogenesis protein CcmH
MQSHTRCRRKDIDEALKMSTITVEIRLAPGSRVSPDETVLVVAWAASGVRVPIAMDRLAVSELPATIILDDSMAMDPEQPLSAYQDVMVEARVAASADTPPAPGDPVGRAEVADSSSRHADIVIASGVAH